VHEFTVSSVRNVFSVWAIVRSALTRGSIHNPPSKVSNLLRHSAATPLLRFLNARRAVAHFSCCFRSAVLTRG
jgi:hypothetical protein